MLCTPSAGRLRSPAPPSVSGAAALVVIALAVFSSAVEAQGSTTPTNLDQYGTYLTLSLGRLVATFRTILFLVLIFGLLWFVAMFVSGRPAIKPIITCVVAAILLGGIQVVLNTFIKVEDARGINNVASDILQTN